jgi:GT2 family glycosyltransferase
MKVMGIWNKNIRHDHIPETDNLRIFLQESQLFQPDWYLARYVDVAAAGTDPLGHYLTRGEKLGYDPNPFFDVGWYLNQHPDVAASGMSPLAHYITWGEKLNYNPNPFFDVGWYLKHHSDVAASGMSPLAHYISPGRSEGRLTGPLSELESIDPDVALIMSQQLRKPAQTFTAKPRVSIIMPVHGQWVWTKRCLEALLRTEVPELAEVIVVNDASPDDTLSRLHNFPWVKVLDLPQNLGFTLASNRGVSQATGEFILFLNNDTEPLPGFLHALVDAMDADPTIGLVGSRLIYSDGVLQEAGGIIWSDGSGRNFGRGQSGDLSAAQMQRDVDYCSGASILVRTSTMQELGGFDPRYAPAYYEDADLAFTLRKRGQRVICEPKSVVVHHEGGSHGTDTTKGIKAYQIRNKEIFVEKWKEELRFQYSLDEVPPRRAVQQRHNFRRTILFIDHNYLTPLHDSGSCRSYEIIKLCQELGYEAAFASFNQNGFTKEAIALRDQGIHILAGADKVEQFLSEEYGYVAAIFISRVNIYMNWLRTITPRFSEIPFVFDTVDLHHLREHLAALNSKSEAGLVMAQGTKRRELHLVKSSAVTIVVNELEKEYLQQVVPGAQVAVVPTIHHLSDSVTHWNSRKGLFFVGGYGHPPNLDALRWFLHDIWPLLDPAIQSAGIDIVGANPPEEIKKLDSPTIRVHGWVEDIAPMLHSTRLSLAPLRSGAGVKGKIGEAWSYGVPVIGTTLAFNGMASSSDSAYLVADTPTDFAVKISDVYNNEVLWNTASDSGRQIIEKRYSRSFAKNAIAEILQLTNQL